MQSIYLEIKDEEDGVFAISLVGSPAIEENFVALSKDEIELKVIDEERRIVVGFALVPEKEILRIKDDKKFNIKFTKETVSKTAELFMKNLNGANVTSEHKKPVMNCYVQESWIVEDVKNDKSNIWNLGAKGGEWVVMMKLTPEEFAKASDGIYKGFSIEGQYDGFDKLEQSADEQLIEDIKNLLK